MFQRRLNHPLKAMIVSQGGSLLFAYDAAHLVHS